MADDLSFLGSNLAKLDKLVLHFGPAHVASYEASDTAERQGQSVMLCLVMTWQRALLRPLLSQFELACQKKSVSNPSWLHVQGLLQLTKVSRLALDGTWASSRRLTPVLAQLTTLRALRLPVLAGLPSLPLLSTLR